MTIGSRYFLVLRTGEEGQNSTIMGGGGGTVLVIRTHEVEMGCMQKRRSDRKGTYYNAMATA